MALLEKKTEVKEKQAATPAGKKAFLSASFANGILRKPRITEKAYLMNARNEYVFEVAKRATKREVARAVEAVYGVTVVAVRTTSLPGRKRRFGRTIGTVSGVKKAIVKLKEGDSLTLIKAGL
jgi:large subunit ribosomal protein L23